MKIPKPNVPVYAIVAMDEKRCIGQAGALPWNIPADLKHFSGLTRRNTVLMGRKTYDSLPDKFRPLPDRLNLVLSKSKTESGNDNLRYLNGQEAVAEFLSQQDNLRGDCLWVIGGANIYQQTVSWWDRVYLTRVFGEHKGDAFFPEFEQDFKLTESVPSEGCVFEVYERIRNSEVEDKQ